MDANDEIVQLFRIRTTINELLTDRGYIVAPAELKQNLEQFKEEHKNVMPGQLRDGMMKLVKKWNDETDSIFVFYTAESRLGVSGLKKYFTDFMEKMDVTRAILVLKGSITPYAKQLLDSMAAQDPSYTIEKFQETELLVNITQHVLVPKHSLLSPDDTVALLEKYKLKLDQLPCIQRNDPVARYMGLNRNQVVKITRASETAGRYITYRRVV